MRSGPRRRYLLRIAAVGMCASTLVGGAAHAQGSVTLYGLTDAGLLYTSGSRDSATAGNAGHQFSFLDSGSAASRFGIKGAEDIGDGIKTIFDLESGISVANGAYSNSNGNFFGRQAWVGLTGGFGTVQAGLQFSPFVLSVINMDARSASYFGSGAALYVGSVYTTGLFNPNALSYTSPVIAGFQASAMIAPGGQPGNFKAGWQYSGRLKYQLKGLMIDAALYSSNAANTAATIPVPSTIEFTGRAIGVSYEFEALTLKASYLNLKVAGAFDSRVCTGGFSYFVTTALNIDAGVWYTSDGNNTSNHSILTAIGTQYSLSKRTSLYAQVALVNNHGKMDTGLSINDALHEGPGSTTGVNMGIRHAF